VALIPGSRIGSVGAARMRRSFATHVLEDGHDIRERLLCDSDGSTMTYACALEHAVMGVRSPVGP